MKKNIYFLILLLAGMASYGQQNVLATVQLPGDVKEAIIREYEYPQTISYIRTTDGCCFALADNNFVLTCVWLDCDYIVYDFEIRDEFAYFCGVDSSVGQGFVGWFDCNALFSGSDGYHIYNQFYAVADTGQIPYTIKYVRKFTDLTIFTSPEYMSESVHLALVGETTNGTACVAELVGLPYSSNWIYNTGGSANLPTNQLEFMNQVVATDHYIVTGGTFEGNTTGISMRIFDRNDMFGLGYSTLYNVIHRYPTVSYPGTGRLYPMAPTFRMAAANGDSVTTASFLDINNYGMPDYDGIITHIFDIFTTAYFPGSPCAYNSWVYINNTKGNCGINSLTYSHPFSSLQVLAETNTLNAIETVLGEFSVPAVPMVPYTIVNNYWFYCHDNFDGENSYVAIGKNRQDPMKLAFYTQPLMDNAPPCGTVQDIPAFEEVFQLKDEPIPLFLYSDEFEFDEITPNMDSYAIEILCEGE